MALKQLEAVGVDRADEAAVQVVKEFLSHASFCALLDASSKLIGCTLREGERYERVRLHAVGEEIGNALRDDLGLAGASGRDDLEMTTSMLNGRQGIAF